MSRRCPSCGETFADEAFFCGYDGTITLQEQDPNDYDPRLGEQLGEYVAVARVADGAMGRVYEGRHPQTHERVAIKVLHSEMANDTVSVERLKREHDTARELDHPHVIQVFDLGQTQDDSWFVTMEYLRGEELRDLIAREGALPPERAIRIASQVALALDHAHTAGIIHRDLKPDNVFLSASDDGDFVKILDFGSVKLQMEMGPKLTAYGTTLGSPYYMSPEQAMGKQDVDPRTDVFALATIIHEMMTGKVAFDGGAVTEILMKILNENPTPASTLNPLVPPAVDDVVEKGVRKDKTRRYETTVALVQAMGQALGLEGDPEQWARTSQHELGQRVANAQPPAPKPFGATSVPPATEEAAPQASGSAGPRGPALPPDAEPGAAEGGARIRRPGPGTTAVLGLAALAVAVVVGGALVAAYLLLS